MIILNVIFFFFYLCKYNLCKCPIGRKSKKKIKNLRIELHAYSLQLRQAYLCDHDIPKSPECLLIFDSHL